MKKELIISLKKSFEEFAHKVGGVEFWFARDLQKLLDYDKWENFVNVIKINQKLIFRTQKTPCKFFRVIEKAKTAYKNSNQHISDHFAGVRKMVQLGSGAE